MGKKIRSSNLALIAIGVVFLVCLVVILIVNNRTQTKAFWDNRMEKLALITETCTVEINEWITFQTALLNTVAGEAESGRLRTRKECEDYLAHMVSQNPAIQSAYISLDDGVEYFNSDFIPNESAMEIFGEFYRQCKEAGGKTIITEPYFDYISGGLVVSCLKAITMPDGTEGIVGTDISLALLSEKIDSLAPSRTGGTWLVSPGMKVITYRADPSFLPIIIDETTEIDLTETLDNEARTPRYIVQSGVAFLNADWVLQQMQVLEYIDTYVETKGIALEYIIDYDGIYKYESTTVIPYTGWILGVNIPLPDYDEEVQTLIKGQYPTIAMALLSSAASVIIAFLFVSNERRRQTLEKNVEIAHAASKTKSEFLSKMSHEMRTPMNAIIGMTKIADTTNDIEKLRYCLSTIEASSTHLLGIINDILDMSKIEAGKLELDNAPMNLEKVLMKLCNLVVDKTEQKSQSFDIILGKNMRLHYIGDDLRLSQVLTNLLSNAVKFTPERGRITLSVDEVGTDGERSILRFSIADTGIGMTEEQIGRLFRPFEQADGNITRRFGGTGLGLVISKTIIERMDGHIDVVSAPGQGTTFTFEVKLTPAKQPDTSVIFNGIRPGDLRVLVVDDDDAMRAHFLSILDGFGIGGEEAASGGSAVSLVSTAKETRRPYDIIFLDYDMPDMNGLDVVRALSAEIDKNTVIILTSFLTWNKIEAEARHVGVSRFLTKPLFPSAILDAINETVGRTMKNLGIKAEQAREVPDFSDVTLLLAEDVDINREIFIALLEQTGISIEIAENGQVAVEKFRADPYHYQIIIMDVQMPEMDGYEATRIIRAMDLPWAAEIPIIAMTANVFKEDIERCLASGMDDHLPKPIDERVVVEKIRRHLKNR